MKKLASIYFFSFLLGYIFIGSSCGNERSSSGKSVQEIQVPGEISSIIRSPISADGSIDTVNVAKMSFEETTFNFGEVNEGDIVSKIFKFKNNGKQSLIIQNAHSSCGCTVPQWPKDPIGPGEEGEIKVEFNTSDKPNYQEKTVTITANTYPSTNRVLLKGFVIKRN